MRLSPLFAHRLSSELTLPGQQKLILCLYDSIFKKVISLLTAPYLIQSTLPVILVKYPEILQYV
jgi:hypothetical protein